VAVPLAAVAAAVPLAAAVAVPLAAAVAVPLAAAVAAVVLQPLLSITPKFLVVSILGKTPMDSFLDLVVHLGSPNLPTSNKDWQQHKLLTLRH
jgi:hypothetical protein